MKAIALILLLLLVCVCVFAAEEWSDLTPGLKGQASSYDPQSLTKGQARLIQNLRVDEKLGALVQRQGLFYTNTEDSIGALLAAYGFYDASKGHKILVGVEAITASTDTVFGRFVASDTFNTELHPFTSTGYVSWIDNFGFAKDPAFTREYDFEKVNNLLVICDGSNPPWVFSTQRSVVDTTADTSLQTFFGGATETFDPHIATLCPEAPGQLRASVYNASGNITGKVRYKIAYTEDGDLDLTYGDAGDRTGVSGLPSRVVYVTGKKVKLSLFEGHPAKFGEDSTTRALILRQIDGGEWKIIDTISYDEKDSTTYIDNIASGSEIETFYDDTLGIEISNNASQINSNVPIPGGFVKDKIFRYAGGAINQGAVDFSMVDTTKWHWIAYSYYDPLTGAESPMGPAIRIDSTTGWTDSTTATADPGDTTFVIGYTKAFTKEYERPTWIRVYRSIGNDSSTYIGQYQLRANLMLKDSSSYHRTYLPQWGTDAEWLAGSMTSVKTRFNYGLGFYSPFGQWISIPSDKPGGEPTQEWEVLGTRGVGFPGGGSIMRDGFGETIVRPPFEWGSEIVLSDVVFASGRMWGIGDPEFPQRLYYSAYDSIYNWSPNNYLSLDEDDADEIVAVVKAEGSYGDVLYVFKHNKIILVTGYDPEHDLTFYPISSITGAASKRGIQQYGETIYFLSSNFKIYSLVGQGPPKEISGPVSDALEDLYDYVLPGAAFFESARPNSFQVIDNIVWGDLDKSTSLAYNLPSKTWSTYEYGRSDSGTTLSATPFVETAYDTLDNDKGFRADLRYYFDESGRIFVTGNDRYDRMASATEATIPTLIYSSPCLGDGVGLWRILEVTLTAKFNNAVSSAADSLKVEALDREGTVLATVERNISGSNSTTSYRIQLPEHGANCVSFKITVYPEHVTGAAVANLSIPTTIYEIRCEYERIKGAEPSY